MSWHLKSHATGLFIQQCVRLITKNIKALHYFPLWGKPAVTRGFSLHMMTSSNGKFSALLAFCAGNSPVPGDFPAQRPVTWSFDVFFDLYPNKRLSKQWWGWWFETPLCPLWRHRNDWPVMWKTFPCHDFFMQQGLIPPRSWFSSQHNSNQYIVPNYLSLLWTCWRISGSEEVHPATRGR